MRTLLLGIDALDPDVIQDVKTPHIDSVGESFEVDTYGNSGPSWATVMTGQPPEVHGVKKLNPQANSQAWQGTPIWEKVDGYAGIANVPMTYPPDTDIDGWMVTGLMTPKKAIYTAPRGLYRELDELGYRVDVWVENHKNHPHGHFGTVPFEFDADDRDRMLDELKQVLQLRGTGFVHLIEERPVDFTFLCFTTLDRVQHLAMHDRDRVHEFYRLMDEQVGRVLEATPDDAEILLTSDHGMTEVDIPSTSLTGEHRPTGYGAASAEPLQFASLEELHEKAVASANRSGDVTDRLRDLGYL
jgi:predicted AlkP superfamily phosphohydrolase/phosphomutase